MRARRLLLVAAVVIAGALAMPAAKGVWSTTRDVSADGWTAQDSPTVAVDRQGDRLSVTQADSSPTGPVAVVWQQRSHPYQIHAIFGP